MSRFGILYSKIYVEQTWHDWKLIDANFKISYRLIWLCNNKPSAFNNVRLSINPHKIRENRLKIIRGRGEFTQKKEICFEQVLSCKKTGLFRSKAKISHSIGHVVSCKYCFFFIVFAWFLTKCLVTRHFSESFLRLLSWPYYNNFCEKQK